LFSFSSNAITWSPFLLSRLPVGSTTLLNILKTLALGLAFQPPLVILISTIMLLPRQELVQPMRY